MRLSRRRSMLWLAAAGAAGAGPRPARAAEARRLVLLLNGNLGDKSFFDSANRGFALIREREGASVEAKVVEMGFDQPRWEPSVRDAAEAEWDLIVTGTYQMVEVIEGTAADYPDKRFVVFDASVPYGGGAFANVHSITYKQNEGAFLAGAMGAALLKAGAVPAGSGRALGFLGGLDIPVINDFLVGYVAGARQVDPGMKVAVSYIGSFSDAAKGKELALAQYRGGVGIGFNVASQAGLGQLAAAKEADRLAIGVDSDQAALFAPTDPEIARRVVTSVLKNVDASLVRAWDRFKAGALPFGRAEAQGLEDGAIGLADNPFTRAAVPEAIRAEVDALRRRVVAGEVRVPTALGMPTGELDALRASVRP